MSEKIGIITFVTVALLLSGCTDQPVSKVIGDQQPQTQKQEEPKPESDSMVKVGDTKETPGGTFTMTAKNDKQQTLESGSIRMTITEVNVQSGKLKGELKSVLKKDEADFVAVKLKVENTSEDTISIYPDQATITTNTGEQVNADLFLSDEVGGEFIGKVKKEGRVVFFLERSRAANIKWVRLVMDGAHNEELENVGEKIDIKTVFE